MADSEIWTERFFLDGFGFCLGKSSFLTAKSFKKCAKLIKIFACGASKLKNFYYKQPKIGAEGAENFGGFLDF